MTDNWIEWEGGEWDKPPVPDTTHIDVRFRNGTETDLHTPEMLWWNHHDISTGISRADIIAYRIVKPE